jgi:pimeloyl-ACP methyl ester carboxylesterase
VAQELGLRYEGLVERQCLFNTIMPFIYEDYEAAGIEPPPKQQRLATADYFFRQGNDADGLAAELDTPQRRRAYIAQFYGPRLWGAPGSFSREDIDFMTEPFADPDKLRGSISLYEVPAGVRAPSEMSRFFERNPLPTLLLYGPEDNVIWSDFPERAEVVFSERVGPFIVTGAGHYLPWERPDIFNPALIYFFKDLIDANADS